MWEERTILITVTNALEPVCDWTTDPATTTECFSALFVPGGVLLIHAEQSCLLFSEGNRD